MANSEFAEICFKAAGICLAKRIPFALTFLPGSDEPHFAATASKPSRLTNLSFSQNGFVYNLFGSRNDFPLFIPADVSPYDIEDVAGVFSCEVAPWSRSTEYEEYCRRVGGLIETLRQTRGKTVISRAISESVSRVDWIGVCHELFSLFTDTYRFIYYTPQTGAWLGATPELLLDYDSSCCEVKTMSLAGTRPAGAKQPWDAKNIREHDFVTNYIISRFNSAGVTSIVSEAKTLGYGLVEHLCHRISADNVQPDAVLPLLASLSPTPALAGFPLEDALRQIAEVEGYPRICYGGYVGDVSDSRLHCYVNLRSVHFSPDCYCLFTGGGITSDSIPDQEWRETEAKSRRLLQIINRHRNDSDSGN